MNLYLLDGASAVILLFIPVAIFLFLGIWGFLEGWILYLYRLNTYWRCVKQAILVNFASLIAGFIILSIGSNTGSDEFFMITGGNESLPAWGIYFVSTVLVEAVALKMLYRQNWGRMFIVSMMMNILSYILLYLFVYYAF
jgi:hypothetical protein